MPTVVDLGLTLLVIGLIVVINLMEMNPTFGLFILFPLIMISSAYWMWRSFRAVVFLKQNYKSISYARLFSLLLTNIGFWALVVWPVTATTEGVWNVIIVVSVTLLAGGALRLIRK